MTVFQKCLALSIAVTLITLSFSSNIQAGKRKRNNKSSSTNKNSNKNSSTQKRFDNNKNQNNKNQNNKIQNNKKQETGRKFNFDKNRKNDKNYKNDKNFKNNSNNNKNNETNKKWDFNKKNNTDKNKNFKNNKDQWNGKQNNNNRNQRWSVSKNRISEGEHKGKYKWHSGVYNSYKSYQKDRYTPSKKGFAFSYRHQKKKTYKNPYSNPVVVTQPAPVVTGGPESIVIDRSVSAPTPAPAFDDSVQLAGQEDLVTETDEGKDNFEQAREAFFAGDLKSALSLIEQSTKEMPGNPNVQQFRSLVLFAMKDYDKSAAAAYTALTIGPGWDWDTLISLFPSAEIYTSLLRSLEADMKKDPSVTSKKFLLAYHYLMLDEKEAAGRQLAAVVKAEPRNEVALQLFKMTGGTPVVEKPLPPKPME